MGNLCSKSANQDDNFSQPGRVLGNAAANTGRASAPVSSKKVTSSPGRTLGGGGGEGDAAGDARSAAARAAEERAMKANKSGGKLQGQLSAQKKQTQNQLLQAGSDQERGARVQDANAEARNWN